MNHTSEPWRAVESLSFCPGTSYITSGNTVIACGLSTEDAQRIAACVNALKDVEIPERQTINVIDAKRLVEDRAKLLLFLESFIIAFDIAPSDLGINGSCDGLIHQARELLETISGL